MATAIGRTGLLNRAADDGAGGESGKREPVAVMITVTRTAVAVTTVAIIIAVTRRARAIHAVAVAAIMSTVPFAILHLHDIVGGNRRLLDRHRNLERLRRRKAGQEHDEGRGDTRCPEIYLDLPPFASAR